MAWFKVDDQLPDHRKFRQLGKDRLAATGLWATVGAWCGANLTDGFVPDEIVSRYDARHRLARRLVDVGLWEPEKVEGESGYVFHDWGDMQPSRAEVLSVRAGNARRAALHRDPELTSAVRERDANRCRYCSVRVSWKDRRSGTGGTYDHVDPQGDNSLGNVVVACRACNTKKGDRTPDQAGMSLLPPGGGPSGPGPGCNSRPTPDLPQTQNGSRTDHDPGPARPDPTRPSSSAAAPDVSPDRARDSGGGRAADLVHTWTQDHPGVTEQRAHDLTDAVADLLEHGADPALIPAALDAAHTDRWRNPIRGLPYAYEDARRADQATPTTTRTPSTTDQRVAAAQALKTRHRDHPTGLRALPGGA